jgi:hypothetical protein
MACRFLDTIRPTGRTIRGVRIMKLKEGDTIVISSCGFAGKCSYESVYLAQSRPVKDAVIAGNGKEVGRDGGLTDANDDESGRNYVAGL